MPHKQVHFYFDYLSGYSYFAWLGIEPICRQNNAELVAHPVLFAALLNHWKQLGPAEIPPKREFVFKHGCRYAALNKIEFNPPKFHPFNPLPALRASLKEVAGDNQQKIINTIWKAGWVDGIDLGNVEELENALNKADLNGKALLEKTKDPVIKETLRRETDLAIAKGVFGVPTMMVDDELFWGNDQMEFVSLYLQGRDPLDRKKAAEIISKSRAADRESKGQFSSKQVTA